MPAVLTPPIPTLLGRPIPPSATQVIASGVCSLCDSRFQDEPALAWPNPRVPGGWVYVEIRHLDEEAKDAEADDRGV